MRRRSGPWRRWTRFWFDPVEPDGLGMVRSLVFGGTLLQFGREDPSAWADVDACFWNPRGVFRFLEPPRDRGTLQGLQRLWKVCLGLAAGGLGTRVTVPAAAALSTYMLGLPHNYGKIHHQDAALVASQWVLAASRCGDAWAVDAGRAPSPSGAYRWPIQLLRTLTALVMVGAASSKLRHGGLRWVSAESQSVQFSRVGRERGRAASDRVARLPWLMRLTGPATMLVEMSAPLALLSRRFRRVSVPAQLGLLAGIRASMGIDFRPLAIVYVAWVPWERLRRPPEVRSRRGPRRAR